MLLVPSIFPKARNNDGISASYIPTPVSVTDISTERFLNMLFQYSVSLVSIWIDPFYVNFIELLIKLITICLILFGSETSLGIFLSTIKRNSSPLD